MKKSMKNPIFIRLLEYGEETGLRGLSYNEILQKAISEEYVSSEDIDKTKLSEKVKSLISQFCEVYDIPDRDIRRTTGSKLQFVSTYGKVKYVLKSEYYYRLIEYRELEEAREAASRANRNAMWAIGISVVALVATVMIGFAQLNNSVKFDDAQLKEMTTSMTKSFESATSASETQVRSILDAIRETTGKPLTINDSQIAGIIEAIQAVQQHSHEPLDTTN